MVSEVSHHATPKIAITLVHGTWGRLRLPFRRRAPLWFEEGSEFVERLLARLRSRGLDADISSLFWSGANSVSHRHVAAGLLATRLREQQKRDQNVRQVIIGHSHGGTVAMLAMQHFEKSPVLITLATPFMEAQRRFLGFWFGIFVRTLWAAGGLLLVLALDLRFPEDVVLAAFAMGGIAFITYMFVGSITPDWLLKWAGLEGAPSAPVFSYLSETTRGGLVLRSDGPVLVIRGVDDEAALVLAAGAIGNRLSSGGYIFAVFIMLYGVFAFAGFEFAARLANEFVSVEIRPSVQTLLKALHSGHLRTAALISLASCALLPIASGAFKSMYGREFFFRAFQYQINSQSSPDAQRDIHIVTLPPTLRTGLRHGIYNNEKAPAVAADFIYRSFHGSENRNALSAS